MARGGEGSDRVTEHHDHDHDHGHGHGHGHANGHDHEHEHDHHHHHGGLRGFLTDLFRPHSHDPSDSVDDALTGSAEGIRTVKISLVGLGITAIVQVVVVLFSGSVGLLADTIHNFAD